MDLFESLSSYANNPLAVNRTSNLKPNELVAMLWDFFGPTKKETAEHHKRHLEEFSDVKSLSPERVTVFHGEEKSTVTVVLPWALVQELKPILKPHRGQIWTQKD